MLRFTMKTPPCATPPPIFGARNQVRPHWVSFDIAENGKQMFVVLHREMLESSLVQMSGTTGAVMRMPTHAVRYRQPLKEITDFAIRLRPNDEMPVIGHDDEIQNPKRNPLTCLFHDSLEGLVITCLFEQRQSRHGSIETVKHHFRRANSLSSRHPGSLTCHGTEETSPDPFSSSTRCPH